MKKIIVTLAVALTAVASFAQGHVNFVNSSSTRVSTNSTANYFGDSLGSGGTGQTFGSGTAPQGFYYALLAQSYSGGATASASLSNLSGWTFTGVIGTNALSTGSINGLADATTSAGMPLAAANQFVIVGWSAGLGSSWAAIATGLQNSSLASGNFIGISTVGTGTGSASPPEAVFGGTGITSGFTLFSTTVVPEPGTMVLAGLGGLSLLAFRRKK